MSPYGNYPCSGDDEWVSIAVRTEEEWRGMVEAMGNPAWTDGAPVRQPVCPPQPPPRAGSERLSLNGRVNVRHGRQPSSCSRTEWRPFPCWTPKGGCSIPHFRERGLYSDIEHPALGSEPIFNLMWQMTSTPPSIRRHAPLLGEHNREVFCGLLDLTEADLSRLEEEQVIW